MKTIRFGVVARAAIVLTAAWLILAPAIATFFIRGEHTETAGNIFSMCLEDRSPKVAFETCTELFDAYAQFNWWAVWSESFALALVVAAVVWCAGGLIAWCAKWVLAGRAK